MTSRIAAGSSHIGMCPHPGSTTDRAPRIAVRVGRMSRSRSPNASVTGTSTSAAARKWSERIAVLVAT